MISLIWAQSRDGWIGKDGTMPWHIPEDLAHFKAATAHHPVVMGRATWESLPPRFRPLPERDNIVLTRDRQWAATGAVVAHSPMEALSAAGLESPSCLAPDVWVMGGAAVFAEFLPLARRCVVTEIDVAVPDGDTAAPCLGSELWACTECGPWQTSVKGPRFRFLTYERI